MATLLVRRNLAITSMVLGILGIFASCLLAVVSVGLIPDTALLALTAVVAPFSGLGGLILGIVALVKTFRRPQECGGKGFAIAGICTSLGSLAAVFAIFGLLLPLARGLELRGVCAANLAGNATALGIYAKEHGGQYPLDVDALVTGNLAHPWQLMCPDSEASVKYGGACNDYNNSRLLTREIHEAIHSCYVYIARQSAGDDPRNVLMCDKKGNHGGRGGNVLFADGHTEWVKPYSKVEQLVAQTKERLAAGTRPANEAGAP